MDEYDDLLKNLPTDKPKHPYEDIIQRHAARTGLDPDLVKAVMNQESSNNPRAVSPKGARGLMQLMPATAARYGAKNVNDPEQNITAGTDYLKFLSDKYGGDLDKTLAGYNSGEGAVDRWSARGHNIPPYKETQNYVQTIKKRYGKSGTGGDYSQYDDLLANLDNPQQPATPLAQQVAAAPPPQRPSTADQSYLTDDQKRQVLNGRPPVASGAPAVIAPDYVPPAGPVVADPNDTPSFGTPEERARMAAAQNQPSVIDIGTNLMLARQKSQEIQLQRRHQAAKAAPPTLRHPGAQPVGEPWKAKGATGGLRVNQVPAEAQPTDALSAALNAGANPTSRFGAIKAAVAQPFDPNSPENAQRSQIREQIVNELHPTTAKGRIKQGADVAITTAINPLNVINPSLGAKVAAAQAARRLGLPVQSEDELINAETEKRLSAQQMQAAPEMTQARKNFGKLDPVTRSLSVIPATLFGDAAKMAGGVTSAGATVTGLAGLTPNIVSDYLQTKSDTFNKYGNLFQQASSAAPLDEQGKEIERARTQILGVSVPTEKIASAIGELGTNIGELVLLKRATGMPLDRVMAIETALKTSDLPANERAVRVAESYGMGKVLEAHLSRPVSALLFGGPTAVQSAQSVASGNMSLEDAILNTSIQAGTGAVFGGKKGNGTIRDAEPTGLRERLVNKARLKAADEANPQGRLFTDSGRKVAPTSNVGQTEPTAPRPVEPRQGNLPFEPRQPEPAATEAKNELTNVLQSAIDKSKEPAPEKLTRKEQSLADQEAYAKAQGNYFEETPSGAAPPEQPGQATSTDRRRDTRLATPEEKALLDAAVATHGERRKAEDQRDIANRRAETDKLTGLGNRDALDKALPAAEKDPNTSVVVFDANNLGIVNKLVEHGEIAGDTVVQRAANAINQAAQEAGVPQRVFRRGGDEFVALLPKTQADAITARAEEIMGEQTFKGTHGQTGVPTTARTSLTGSVGDTFEIADRALQGLKAKRKAEGIAAAPATEKAPAKATKAKKTKAAEEAAPQSPEVAQGAAPSQNRSVNAAQNASMDVRGAQPTQAVSESQVVHPWEMTQEQIEEAYQQRKSEDDDLEAALFGPENAKKYARLQRTANSSTASREHADAAADEINRMESRLSKRDQDRLYGIGETGSQLDDLQNYRQSLSNLDPHDPQSLAESMRWAVSKLSIPRLFRLNRPSATIRFRRIGNETDPLRMTHDQQVAYGTLREAARIAHENGWDTQAISRDAVRAAAGRFSDPEDAAFMLDRFLKKPQALPAQADVQPQSPEVAQAEGGEQNAVPKRKSTKVPVADAAQTSEELIRETLSQTLRRIVGAPVPKPKESSDAQGTTTPAPEKVGFRKGDKVTTEEGEGTVDSINGNRVRVMLADGETTRVYPAEALTAKPKTASEKALDKLKKDSAQAGKLAFGDIVGTISKKAEDAFYRAVIKADDYLTSRKEGKFSEWVKSIPSEERIDTPTMRKAFDGAKALQEKERQFPKSAVEAGHTQPTDLTYTVLSNPEAVASAQKTIEDKGLNKAVLDLAHAKDLDAPDIALGILAAKQYASKGDHESEVSVLNDLSAKLTKAGRVVQAASLIDNLTPEGAIIRASRKLAEKSPGAKLSTEQADVIREKVSAIQLAKARVEKYTAKEVALTKGHGSIQDQLEARLGANAEKARAELKRLAQQGGFLGTSPKLPSALKAKLNLFAQVGAHELAKLQGSTGKMEAWKKAMVALDPRLEPFLNKEIFKESYSLFDSTKKSLLEQQRLNSARKTNPLATPSELRVIVNEKLDAQTAARKESIALRRYYDSLGIPTWKKMRDAVTGSLGIYRASESSFDLSASLRQAKIALVRSPAAFAKAFGKQIQAMSPEKYERLLSQLQLDPDFKYAERFGLDLVGFGEHEEAFDAAKLVQNIPGIKHSEQAYTTMLNYTRMGWFKQYSEGLTRLGLDPDNPADRAHFEKGAQMINNATGRGDWGKGNAGALLRSTSHTLSMALFSPRFLASRLYLLKEAGNPLTMLNPKVIAAVGKDIVSKTGRMTNISALEKLGQRHALSNEGRVENFKTVAAYAAVVGMQLTLAKQLGAQVSFDMDDPDFLKAKFGNYHVDVSAGMQGTVRMLLRTMKAIYRGEIAERSGKGESVMGIQSDFWRKKLSPAAAILVDMFGNKQNTGFGADWEGKDFLRQPTYMFGKPGAGLNKINPLSQDGSIIMRKLAPMIADDVKKVIYDNPIDKKGVAAIAGSVLGESIQIYDPKASGKPLRKPKNAPRPRISH